MEATTLAACSASSIRREYSAGGIDAAVTNKERGGILVHRVERRGVAVRLGRLHGRAVRNDAD